MEPTYGISYGGKAAEAEFIRFTGAVPATSASVGDVLLEGYPVEIKRATSATLNQVRAVKYIPVAAYSVPQRAWYVIPAHAIVAEVSRKTRGQHSEIPFESATLSLIRLARFKLASPEELRMATLSAIEAAATYPRLKEEMVRVRREARSVADLSLERIRNLVSEYRIGS